MPAAAAAADRETVRVELDWFIRADGTFVPVSYASAPMAEGAVVVFRDLSDRRATRRRLPTRSRGRPRTPGARSTSCASWRRASTRSCSPTTASRSRSRT